MSFNEVFEEVRHVFENADARAVFEHVAVQVNIEGEAKGCFYIEIANREISVEPYDYHDKDALVTISEKILLEICDGTYSWKEVQTQGLAKVAGNMDKMKLFDEVIVR